MSKLAPPSRGSIQYPSNWIAMICGMGRLKCGRIHNDKGHFFSLIGEELEVGSRKSEFTEEIHTRAGTAAIAINQSPTLELSGWNG
jgi:hypothetical protein